ncbi:MAG: TIGR04002 family protein [Coriobacteriia bacterium]|nr:TIGR04002 family protein [Coriobacteriia bacterium]
MESARRINRTKRVVLAALFTALVFLFTAYILHIPVGGAGAYIHFGDIFIFLAASTLPFPDALFVAAIGASLADFASGASMWIPFTLVIKALMALSFTSRGKKLLGPKRNLAAPFIAGLICLLGYYVAEALLTGNILEPLASVPAGIVQFAGSAILYFVIAKVMDRQDLKEKLL